MTNRITRHSYLYYSICLLLVTLICPRAGAQATPEPIREHLLNGLTVLFWQRPGDQSVFIKLRIESGAAFDLAGKGGHIRTVPIPHWAKKALELWIYKGECQEKYFSLDRKGEMFPDFQPLSAIRGARFCSLALWSLGC